MTERLIKQWNADPNGEMVVKLYEESGFKAALCGVFLPIRIVDVPSGVMPHLYEAVPLIILANQRVEVVREEKVVVTG